MDIRSPVPGALKLQSSRLSLFKPSRLWTRPHSRQINRRVYEISLR